MDPPCFQNLSIRETYSALLCSSENFSLSATPVMRQWSLIIWAFNRGPSFKTEHTLAYRDAPYGRDLMALPNEKNGRIFSEAKIGNGNWEANIFSKIRFYNVCRIWFSSICIQIQQELDEQELDASPTWCCHINYLLNPYNTPINM